jgi:hypothetical protein
LPVVAYGRRILRGEGVREYGAVAYIGTAQTAHNRKQEKDIMRSFALYSFYSSPNIIG